MSTTEVFRRISRVRMEVDAQTATVAWDYDGVPTPIPIGYAVTSRATCDN